MKHDKKVALVTGGNRGIGAEVCRELARKGYAVYLGARDKAKGEMVAEQMKEHLATTGTPKFQKVWCSQCGKEFGPGNSGFSHCENHN